MQWLLWVAFGVLAALPVHARMYQWVNPHTGSTQLSGTPPSWYRGSAGGPRVRVFDNGNLIDDTAIALPRAQAEELRDAAFAELEQRQAALRQLERTAAQAERRRRDERQRIERQREELAARSKDAPSPEAPTPSTTSAVEIPDDPAKLSAEAVQRLKALLSEFDRQGGELARQ